MKNFYIFKIEYKDVDCYDIHSKCQIIDYNKHPKWADIYCPAKCNKCQSKFPN